MPWDAAEPLRRNIKPVGRHSVVQRDCLEGLAELPDGCIDVVVTSPPYNIGVAYNTYDDNIPRGHYLEWISKVASELCRVMTDDASLFLNVGSTNTDPWISMEVAATFRNAFHLQNHIIWAKSVSVGDNTVGHFKPVNSTRFLNQNHESIFHFSKTNRVELDRLAVGVPFKDKSNIGRWGHARDKRCAGNIWFIPYRTVRSRSQKFDHPAGFPVELPERCLRLHGCDEDTVVLDPFLGTGSTLVAASRVGCRGVGFELDPAYAKTAVCRLEAEGV